MKNNWKPIRRNEIYCSPSCGGDCKHSDYLRAKEISSIVAKTMKDYKPNVWENLGWHWSIVSKCKRIKIHPSEYRNKIQGYIAFIGPPCSGGCWTGKGSSPQLALKEAQKVMNDSIKPYVDLISQ